MKAIKMRITTMATGALVAFGIICSHFFYFPSTPHLKKETKTEQHQQTDSGEQAYFSLPSTSLPSTAHVEINPDVFFLFEFIFEKHTLLVPEISVAVPLGQFFRTIFGLTISPNAP
jgi:hypothetical protein